jgi:hypothetical protein
MQFLCLFFFSSQHILTVLVPLLLSSVVAHGAEILHERAHQTVMMDLSCTIEVSLAQLKQELNLVLESTNRSAIGVTTYANAPSPPPTIRGTEQIILVLERRPSPRGIHSS